MKRIALFIAAIFFIIPTIHAEENSTVMVVFDASGSMWGQIDGKTKIEIAREAFTTLSSDWAHAGISAGLVAYGHRRKGDCSDIEVLATPSIGATPKLSAMVNRLTPTGKTPLSDAVVTAARVLKYTENKATVILLSDGKETCSADPCAVGAELEKLGVDFTAHVIGFDIIDQKDKAQLQCLAQNTGGKYFDAGDADSLGEALKKVTELQEPTPVAPEPKEPEPTGKTQLRLDIVEQGNASRPQNVQFTAKNLENDESIVLGKLTDAEEVINGLKVDLKNGRWLISATGPAGSGDIEVSLVGGEKEISIPYSAIKPSFTMLDKGPFLVNNAISFRLLNTAPLEKNAQFSVGLFPAGATEFDQRITHTYRFGNADGPVETGYFAHSNKVAGNFEIIITKGSYDLADAIARFPIKVVSDPKLVGPSMKENIAKEALNDQANNSEQKPSESEEGLSADQHGYEPVVKSTSVDAELLWDLNIGNVTPDDQFIFECNDNSCSFDYKPEQLTDIPLAGGWALEEPIKLRDGKISFHLIDRMNGEWIAYNPSQQTNGLTLCIEFLKEGHHSVNEQDLPNLDQLCSVIGAGSDTADMLELLEEWAIKRNNTQ